MKKITLFLLTLCICFSCVVLVSCNSSVGNTDEGNETNGWLLPTRIKAGEYDLELIWTENKCTFEIENTVYTFTYDKASGGLDVTIDGGTDYFYEDLCVFDSEDRIQSISFQGSKLLEMSYSDNNMLVSAYEEGELGAPKEISVDWNERKMPMPPFDNPDDYLFFTEWGDLYAGEDVTLYSYQYDEKGNIVKISIPELSENYSWELSYGEAAMTMAWQRTVNKFLLPFVLGRPLATFAMDMMCFGAYQQHNAK